MTQEQIEEARKKKRREYIRLYRAKKRKELSGVGLEQYSRVIKKEFFPLMDARLAELNKGED